MIADRYVLSPLITSYACAVQWIICSFIFLLNSCLSFPMCCGSDLGYLQLWDLWGLDRHTAETVCLTLSPCSTMLPFLCPLSQCPTLIRPGLWLPIYSLFNQSLNGLKMQGHILSLSVLPPWSSDLSTSRVVGYFLLIMKCKVSSTGSLFSGNSW